MTIKASGPISGNDIRTEFGGTGPISPSNYYRVAGLDAADRVAGQVPSTMTTGGGGTATIEVDFTGTSVSQITPQRAGGTWLTSGFESSTSGGLFLTTQDAEGLAAEFEMMLTEDNTLASGVSITRDGVVVTITRDESFTFWVYSPSGSTNAFLGE